MRRCKCRLSRIGKHSGRIVFMTFQARSVVVIEYELWLLDLLGCNEVVRIMAVLTGEKLVVFFVAFIGYDDMIFWRQSAAFRLLVLVFRKMNRFVELIRNPLELIGLVVLSTHFFPRVTIHANVGFHVHVRILLETLFMTLQAFQFAVISFAKTADFNCYAARLAGFGVRQPTIGTRVTSEALKPLEVKFALFGDCRLRQLKQAGQHAKQDDPAFLQTWHVRHKQPDRCCISQIPFLRQSRYLPKAASICLRVTRSPDLLVQPLRM